MSDSSPSSKESQTPSANRHDDKPSTPKSAKRSPKKVTPSKEKEIDPTLNIITEPSMNAIANYVKAKDVKRILVLTGAGISTAVGIPDFRSPGSGLYDNLRKYSLPYPEAIFDIKYFRRNPQPFYTLARELYPGAFRPTTCHYFIRLLQDKGLLLRNYTQNIDTLERVAGVTEDLLVEAHGSFAKARCKGKVIINKRGDTNKAPDEATNESESDDEDITIHPGCGREYSQAFVKTKIFAGEIPKCEACDGLIKPDIVFFGESLPERFHTLLKTDFNECDLIIVIGTSLQVQPFSHLINFVPYTVPRLLINREIVGIVESSSSLGFDFVGDRHRYRRDALWLGSCDDGCLKLAELLGWEDELKALMEREIKSLESHQAADNAKDIAEAIGEAIHKSEDEDIAKLVEGIQKL